MKTWYHAVCRSCCESVCVMVSNPNCTGAYLGKHSGPIQEWLTRHGGCRLELIHSDQDLDVLFEAGWRPLGDFYPQGKEDTNWKLDREGLHLIVKPRDPDDLSIRSLRAQLALPEERRRLGYRVMEFNSKEEQEAYDKMLKDLGFAPMYEGPVLRGYRKEKQDG